MSTTVLKRQQEAVRAAKLALLKIEARQTIDQTDASARIVEEASTLLIAGMISSSVIAEATCASR